MNAVLFGELTASWPSGLGKAFVSVAMLSATALLFIAAQAGFLDGPRVLANMAMDRWFPSRFATLSDRFVAQNGILLMGGAALVVLLATRGAVGLLMVLYSINVFITFSLSQLGMVRHWWTHRRIEPHWRRKLFINGIGLCLTTFILISLSLEKFWEGGWVTLLVTGLFVATAFLIRRHYRETAQQLARLDSLTSAFTASPMVASPAPPPACDPAARTAVLLVNGFNGLGVHTLLSVLRMFPGLFRNFVFVQVGVVDAGNFKGANEIENLKRHVNDGVERYAAHVRREGYHVETATAIGHDAVTEAKALAMQIVQRFPNAVFFGGQLVFANESRLGRLLHNFTVFALQREFFRDGLPFLIVPIRV